MFITKTHLETLRSGNEMRISVKLLDGRKKSVSEDALQFLITTKKNNRIQTFRRLGRYQSWRDPPLVGAANEK